VNLTEDGNKALLDGSVQNRSLFGTNYTICEHVMRNSIRFFLWVIVLSGIQTRGQLHASVTLITPWYVPRDFFFILNEENGVFIENFAYFLNFFWIDRRLIITLNY
jgi:hypothetical protein